MGNMGVPNDIVGWTDCMFWHCPRFRWIRVLNPAPLCSKCKYALEGGGCRVERIAVRTCLCSRAMKVYHVWLITFPEPLFKVQIKICGLNVGLRNYVIDGTNLYFRRSTRASRSQDIIIRYSTETFEARILKRYSNEQEERLTTDGTGT